MNIDFVHIGYHKTASSWLQLEGFRRNPDVFMCNDARTEMDSFFVSEFVKADELAFDSASFLEEFSHKVNQAKGSDSSLILGISEENLSGHYWNGGGEKLLIDRVKQTFGDTKVIISIRNQLDMLNSLYANYVKAGAGTKSFKRLLNDESMLGDMVFRKLCYHRLIEYSEERFGVDNVMVFAYEEFATDPGALLNQLFAFVGAGQVDIEKEVQKKKVNAKYSVPSEYLLRQMNCLGLRSRYLDKALQLTDRYLLLNQAKRGRDSFVRQIPGTAMQAWVESNRKVSASRGIDLVSYGYVC